MATDFPITLDNPRGNSRTGDAMGSATGGNARILTIGPVRLFFSFASLVAVEAPGLKIRTSERFSNTTTKHLREMECAGFAPLDPDLFALGAQTALVRGLGGG